MMHLVDHLKQNDVEFSRNFKISDFSTVRIGGYADLAVFPQNEKQMISLLDYLYAHKIKHKILGRISNVLAADDGYRGVLVLTHKYNKFKLCDGFFVAEAGASISGVIYRLAEKGLAAMEELFGIPASVGGAVYNNAGAFGSDISASMLYGRVYSPKDKRITVLSRDDMMFSYRDSILKHCGMIFLEGAFAFKTDRSNKCMDRIMLIKEKRIASQPYSLPSLGSSFKRKSGVPLSRLVDEAGLKGVRIGGAEISSKHAGFIVNTGGASSSDYKALVRLIKDTVYKKYGFYPTEEIEYL